MFSKLCSFQKPGDFRRYTILNFLSNSLLQVLHKSWQAFSESPLAWPWYNMTDLQRVVVMKVVTVHVQGSVCLLVFSTDGEEDDDSTDVEWLETGGQMTTMT
jgi:hypothetical protein